MISNLQCPTMDTKSCFITKQHETIIRTCASIIVQLFPAQNLRSQLVSEFTYVKLRNTAEACFESEISTSTVLDILIISNPVSLWCLEWNVPVPQSAGVCSGLLYKMNLLYMRKTHTIKGQKEKNRKDIACRLA